MWIYQKPEAFIDRLRCASALLKSEKYSSVRMESAAALLSGLLQVSRHTVHTDTISDICAAIFSDNKAPLLTMAEGNRWLFSHQPGLWDRSFLLSVLSDEHEENPWMNELMGSQRAMLAYDQFAYLPSEWYEAVSDSGSLKESGLLMEQQIRTSLGEGALWSKFRPYNLA